MASAKGNDAGPSATSVEVVVKDISERFPHLGISLSDMCTPSSEFVIKVLLAYLTESFLCHIPPPSFERESSESYPEVYQHIHVINKLHTIFSIILKACYFDSFSFSDLTQPTPRRTKEIFELVENMVRFREMKIEELQPLFETLKNRKETYENLRAKNEQLRQELNNRASNRAKREAHAKELLKEQKAKKINIEKLLVQQKIVTAKESQIQSEVHKCKLLCESLSQQSLSIDADINNLKVQVVENPEELTKKLEDRKQQLDQLVADVKETNEDLRVRKGNIKLLDDLADGQKIRTKMLKDINVLASYVQGRENSCLIKESERKILLENMKGDQDKVTMKKDSINHLHEQIVSLKLQKNAKEAQQKKSMTTLKTEYLEIKNTHGNLTNQSLQLNKSLEESQEKCKQLEATILRADQYIEKKYNDIVAEQEKFDAEIEQDHLAAIAAYEHQQKKEKGDK